VKIEVAHARTDVQFLIALHVPEGATVRQAIELSGLLEMYPDVDLERQAVGIFGRPCGLEDPLQDGDRVEVYRRLLLDPKLRRRQRAALQRSSS
jgi:putative ubiquitin-RnfH superfamily antitoxin RatB of RatAB toxin-antitoxin module